MWYNVYGRLGRHPFSPPTEAPVKTMYNAVKLDLGNNRQCIGSHSKWFPTVGVYCEGRVFTIVTSGVYASRLVL